MDRKDYSLPELEIYACPLLPKAPTKKKNNVKNKSRFSAQQIRMLESIFESETKLEPRKKLQVARELGLQPRQVAIWFQNRRARWKSKQIEQDYKTLRANYDSLASRFESLKNETQSLITQLQRLNELVGKPCGDNGSCSELQIPNPTFASDKGNVYVDSGAQQGVENQVFTSLQNDGCRDMAPLIEAGDGVLNKNEHKDNSSATPEKWYAFDSGSQFDLPCSSSSQWFNFWT
ncbi:hypothetical protein K2173_021842 [Erythroxylum novogranatense]|uniref:Homeobox-leucine zipper protein n=1 Tax=Erythroxylum novogranatense TaxID=1862640 RepID=A0AAV8T353_9ROSI|nr:hypothetical protein K2173_021842 [Erythroxylum novogranatense]